MNKLFALVAAGMLLCGAARAADPVELEVMVKNPTGMRVTGIPVVVPLADYGEVTTANVYGSHDIPFQLDDLDGDGVADELVFVLNINPGYTKHIKVTLNSKEGPQTFEPKSNAYLRLRDERKRHPKALSLTFPGDANNRSTYDAVYGHGSCMESLHNALRIYMDNRQSVDLYGKRSRKLELDSTSFYTTRKQFTEEGYGRDILWAGTSVAAGSFRGLTDGKPVTIDTVASRTQRILASGPVRSIIEVVDMGWKINGKKVNMRQRYIQYGVNPWFTVDVQLDGPGTDQLFCTGIQKIGDEPGKNADAPNKDRNGFITPAGVAASWGENIPDKNHKDLTETLGIGLRVNPANVASVREDDLNYLVELHPDANGHICYDVNFTSLLDPKSPRDYDAWRKTVETWSSTPASLFPAVITVK